MTPPKFPVRNRLPLLAAGGAICAAALFSAVAYAAAAVKPVFRITVEQAIGEYKSGGAKGGDDKGGDSKSGGSNSGGGSSGGAAGKSGGAGKSTTTSNDIFYTITVTNVGKIPAPEGTTVEYHIYIQEPKDKSISVDDKTGTESIGGLAVNAKKVIEPPAVQKKSTMTSGTISSTKGSSKSGGGGVSSTGGSISSSAPIGTYVVIKDADGKKISDREDPIGIQTKVASIQKNMK